MNQYQQTVKLDRQLTPGTAHELATRGFPSKTSIMAERIFSPLRSNTSSTMRENTLPEGSLLLFEPTRRTLSNDELLKAQLKHTNKHTIPTFYPTSNEKVAQAQMYFEENDKKHKTPVLNQSFPPKYAGPIGRKKVHKSESSTQTEKTLYKRQLVGLSEYSTWMFAEVDPFMQVRLYCLTLPFYSLLMENFDDCCDIL